MFIVTRNDDGTWNFQRADEATTQAVRDRMKEMERDPDTLVFTDMDMATITWNDIQRAFGTYPKKED